jgi:diguanylate cyclase (GGDEF)-like protein
MKIYDELTKLYNREGFIEKVEDCLERNRERNYEIIRFVVKNFKFINSIYGRESGNTLLEEIGRKLVENLFPDEICGRFDGDSFVVFIPCEYSKSLREVISDSGFYVAENSEYPVHICAGIYQIQKNEMSVSEMCDRAGIALDTVKENLLEKVAVFDESMYTNLLQEHELSLELPSAIRNGQLQFYLQPQVNRLGVVVGAEALVRWIHPQKGLIMPAEFVPLFEKNYMIVEIDKYIWEKVCQLIRRWADDGREDIYVSINISPRDFECIDVYKVLMGLVKKYQINPEQLKVEITEGTIMKNPMEQIQLIGRLRTAGFYVEMDDFGSGYSSISMLKDIEIDAIKLDTYFLSNTINTDRAKKILKAIIQLIRDVGMTVVAEGVETKKQLDFLSHMGCDMFQGFYFSKPVPVEEFEKKIFLHE